MPKQAQQTRHHRIAEQLRKQLGSLKPGDTIPTVAQLTEDFDAASGTIERALRTLRREGLIKRPPGKQRLVIRRSTTINKPHIALIRPDWVSGDYDIVLNRIQQVLIERDWTYQIYPYHVFDDLNLETALEGATAGVLIPVHEVDASISRWLENASKPMVVLREPPDSTRLHSVAMDNFQIGLNATRYLIKLGHRRIGCLISEPLTQVQVADRVKGWRTALQEADIDSQNLLYSSETPLYEDPIVYSYDYLKDALPLADGQPPFTACFCPGWPSAWALHRHLQDHDLSVPHDMSIIACSEKETYLSFASMPLTGYHVDLDHLGRVFLKILDHALANNDNDRSASCATVGALFVVRESCGPPRDESQQLSAMVSSTDTQSSSLVG